MPRLEKSNSTVSDPFSPPVKAVPAESTAKKAGKIVATILLRYIVPLSLIGLGIAGYFFLQGTPYKFTALIGGVILAGTSAAASIYFKCPLLKKSSPPSSSQKEGTSYHVSPKSVAIPNTSLSVTVTKEVFLSCCTEKGLADAIKKYGWSLFETKEIELDDIKDFQNNFAKHCFDLTYRLGFDRVLENYGWSPFVYGLLSSDTEIEGVLKIHSQAYSYLNHKAYSTLKDFLPDYYLHGLFMEDGTAFASPFYPDFGQFYTRFNSFGSFWNLLKYNLFQPENMQNAFMQFVASIPLQIYFREYRAESAVYAPLTNDKIDRIVAKYQKGLTESDRALVTEAVNEWHLAAQNYFAS